MYKRIKKTRARAQWVGFFYLLGTILLSTLAFMPTLRIEYLNVIPGIRDGKLLWQDLKLGLNLDTINRAIYLIMLLTAVINVIRIFGHLSWLYKKKASKMYGFNRNVYAMQSMGKIFSGAFAGRLIGNTLLLLINGTYLTVGGGRMDFTALNAALISIKELTFGINIDIPVAVVFVVIGVFFRLLCGFLGAKASFFISPEEEGGNCNQCKGHSGGVIEQKREIRRFPALFRNFLQFVTVLAMPLFMLRLNRINLLVADALAGKFTVDIPAFIQIGLFLFWIVLTVHATNTTEYSIDGALGKGMKNFKWFIFLSFAASVALYCFTDTGFTFDIINRLNFNAFALVIGTLGMFGIEILMRNAPSLPDMGEYADEGDDGEGEVYDEDEVDWEYYLG